MLIDREGVIIAFSDDVVIALSNVLVLPAISVHGTDLAALKLVLAEIAHMRW